MHKLSQLVKYYVYDEHDELVLVDQQEADRLIRQNSRMWRDLHTLVAECVKSTDTIDEPITLEDVQHMVLLDRDEYPLIVPNDMSTFLDLTETEVEIDL